jgi:2-C-methyl-D-erythritol 4-phosphate cytidylyltransferase
MRIWAVIPAAGCGTRFGGDVPKQYLNLAGKTVIEHSIERIASVSDILGIVVVLAPGDTLFQKLCSGSLDGAKIMYAIGGVDRASSVLNGLQSLSGLALEEDWVLVHDSVRPCVRMNDITSLISSVSDDSVGGLLGRPMVDTLKHVERGDWVSSTVDRSSLWVALTPQLFRYGRLRYAMEFRDNEGFTDESSALEVLGYQTRVVMGSSDNLKITHKGDLALANEILSAQEKEA